MEPLLALLVIAWFAIWTVVGSAVGWSKGRTLDGALLGLFLSFIGVIVIALEAPTPHKLDVLEHEREDAEASALQDVLGFYEDRAPRRSTV